jgi:hypothetical protein
VRIDDCEVHDFGEVDREKLMQWAAALAREGRAGLWEGPWHKHPLIPVDPEIRDQHLRERQDWYRRYSR